MRALSNDFDLRLTGLFRRLGKGQKSDFLLPRGAGNQQIAQISAQQQHPTFIDLKQFLLRTPQPFTLSEKI
jgi:hypothetical protein